MYRLSPAETLEVERQVKDYIKKVFENSRSSHASPLIFVAEKDGTLRMCRLHGIEQQNCEEQVPTAKDR